MTARITQTQVDAAKGEASARVTSVEQLSYLRAIQMIRHAINSTRGKPDEKFIGLNACEVVEATLIVTENPF